MKKDFPHSKNVISLIRAMEPDRSYDGLEFPYIIEKDKQTLSELRSQAERYGLIAVGRVFGRTYSCKLTEKGCSYHNEIVKGNDEDFLESIRKRDSKFTFHIKEQIDRLRMKPSSRLTITPSGKDYLKGLKDEHARLSKFSDRFSKRKMSKFKREEEEITVLEQFGKKEELSLLDFFNMVKKVDDRRIHYKYAILSLIDKNYLQF